MSTSASPIVLELFPAPAPFVAGTVPFMVPVGFHGLNIYSQFLTLDGSGLVFTSNALRQQLGLH